MITGERLTRAAGEDNSDAAIAGGVCWPPRRRPAGVYGDSAYGTGDLRAALGEAGHTAVIKPRPLKPAVEGGFTLDDFTVDETAGTVTCPAASPGRSPPAARSPSAPHAAAARCAPGAPPQAGRALILHPHDALLRAARADWAARPGLREDYRKYRPKVERAIARIASRCGRRLKLRYRGTARNNAWLHLHRRPQPAQAHQPRPAPAQNGAWALA